MSTTTAKRGASAKFLALLASLTMMIAGLVGVAVAAPASATSTQDLCAAEGGDAVLAFGTDGEESVDSDVYNVPAEYQSAPYFLLAKAGASGYVVFDPPGAQITSEDVGQVNSGEGTEEDPYIYADISNVRMCEKAPEPVAPTVVTTCNSVVVTLNDADADDIAVLVDDVAIEGTEGEGTITYALDGTVSKDVTVLNDDDELFDGSIAACPVTPTCEELGNCPVPTCEELGNCPVVVTETPVVEAAVVAAPLPATVAAPAPAQVTVPAKATLPAAVPAGEGSTGLPMWALAMIAMGMLGAAVAGKQLLGARK